jgi:hypothetical protein
MAKLIQFPRSPIPSVADQIRQLYLDCGIPVSGEDRDKIDEALTGIEKAGVVLTGGKIVILDTRRQS